MVSPELPGTARNCPELPELLSPELHRLSTLSQRLASRPLPGTAQFSMLSPEFGIPAL